MSKYAPVVLFCYKRIPVKVISSLLKNELAKDAELYIFIDGPKQDSERKQVISVIDYCQSITGFKQVELYISDANKGLAKSVIEGVSKIVGVFGKAIVLEDDLEVSPFFLSFMNDALDFFEGDPRIWSISGYCPDFGGRSEIKDDIFLSLRSSSWGWATWKARWERVDWSIPDAKAVISDRYLRLAFEQGGSDLSKMLDLQKRGFIDSWAIRWCFYQFLTSTFSVTPKCSLVINSGFGVDGSTHTILGARKFQVETSPKPICISNVVPNRFVLESFRRFHRWSMVNYFSFFLKKLRLYSVVKNSVKKLLS